MITKAAEISLMIGLASMQRRRIMSKSTVEKKHETGRNDGKERTEIEKRIQDFVFTMRTNRTDLSLSKRKKMHLYARQNPIPLPVCVASETNK